MSRLFVVVWAALAVLQSGCLEEEELGRVELELSQDGGVGDGGTTSPTPACPVQDDGTRTCWQLFEARKACQTNCTPSTYVESTREFFLDASFYRVKMNFNGFSVSSPGTHVGQGVAGRDWTYWENYAKQGDPPECKLAETHLFSEGDRDYHYMSTYNHGRTINSANYTNVSSFQQQDICGKKYDDWRLDAVDYCVAFSQIDGFCDQVCGNDGYTFPEAAIQAIPSQDTMANYEILDFTPKAMFQAWNPQNYGQVRFSWFTEWDGVPHAVPLFGHNSNSDALAQKMMFDECNLVERRIRAPRIPPTYYHEWINNIARYNVCPSACGGYVTAWTQAEKENVAIEDVPYLSGSLQTVQTDSEACIGAGNLEGSFYWNVCGM